MHNKEYIIYALSHPITGEPRYIGKSERGLARPNEHRRLAYRKRTEKFPVSRWIQKLHRENLDYVIEVVEEFPDRPSLMEGEKFYISYFRSLGLRLLNVCDGGEGFTGRHTPEARAKIAAAGTGRKISPEAIEKGAAKRRGVKFTEAHKKALRVHKTGAGAKGVKKTDAHCEAISKAKKGKRHSREHVLSQSRSRGGKALMDETGQVFQTQKDAANFHNIDQGSVRSVLVGKSTHAKGHVFAYADTLAPGQLPAPRQKLPNRGGRPFKDGRPPKTRA